STPAAASGRGAESTTPRAPVGRISNSSDTGSPPGERRRRSSPRARRAAGEHGVEISELQGTGRGGRIRERDVLAALAQGSIEKPGFSEKPGFLSQRSLRSNLAGQVALVTGAARGIGEAIARRLAVNG